MDTTDEISQMIGGMPRAPFYRIKKEVEAKAAVEGFIYESPVAPVPDQ
jgi:hypothetical protein